MERSTTSEDERSTCATSEEASLSGSTASSLGAAAPASEDERSTCASSEEASLSGSTASSLGAAAPEAESREDERFTRATSEESTCSSIGAAAPEAEGESETGWARGDVVTLIEGVSRGSIAVVTEVAAQHCAVVVLDAALSRGLGPLWPSFHQMQLRSSAWRLGKPVVLHGLTSKKLLHLNGLLGIVAKHPRQEHPAFVTSQAAKGGAQAEPQLRLVVKMVDPRAAGHSSVLVEARQVLSPEEYVAKRGEE